MKRALLAAVLTAGVSGLVMAQGAAGGVAVTLKLDEVTAARQAGMALTGDNVAAMKAGIEAGVDPKVFVPRATELAKWAHAYPALFPDGTQAGHDTKAVPAV